MIALSKIQLALTRDSVCMGDDMEDHTKEIKIAIQNSTNKIIMKIAAKYLPHVMGYGHTWDCIFNGKNVAVIKGNCADITSYTDALTFLDINSLYFKYHSATY
jgi:hypothetical protein